MLPSKAEHQSPLRPYPWKRAADTEWALWALTGTQRGSDLGPLGSCWDPIGSYGDPLGSYWDPQGSYVGSLGSYWDPLDNIALQAPAGTLWAPIRADVVNFRSVLC